MGNVTIQMVAQNASDQATLNKALQRKTRESMMASNRFGRSQPKRGSQQPVQVLVKKMDSNQDGRIQLVEFKKQFPRAERLFSRFDTNNDKELDKSELDAARQPMTQFLNLRKRAQGFGGTERE